MRRVAFGIALAAAALLVVAALTARVQNHFEYATPFRLPDHFTYHGRQYLGPSCLSRAEARQRGDLPLRRVASIKGVLTSSKPIMLPRSELASLKASERSIRHTPVVLYVADGGCLDAYGLSGGP